MKKYQVAKEVSSDAKKELKQYSELVQLLLSNRDIKTEKEAEIFLNSDWERDTHDPFEMLNMERAVKRVLQAIDKNEKIVIYSDYDCDGIPGGVVLHDFFKKVGYENFENYIPHRHEEGYGLNVEAVEKLAKGAAKLMITVDCGITDVDEVALARDLGVDVIITDHHVVPEKLPNAYTILDPKQKDETYPFKELCGAGVAFKLVQALLKKGKESKANGFDIVDGWGKWLLDMVGIATVADMVPLVGENRVFAKYGLFVLQKSSRVGLQKLLRKTKINQRYITEDDIGFMIAPRINVAGRMDVPMRAFEMLAERDEAVAGTLMDHLHEINESRKHTVASMVKEIKKELKHREIKDVIVIGNPKWRVGVLGLAANKITEEYDRPAFVWGREGSQTIKGSCRSDGSVHLVDLMREVREEVFIDIGGHEAAGGFSITNGYIHTLEDELISAYQKVKYDTGDSNKTMIDKKMSLDEVSWATYNNIDNLAPFGVGNPKPTFLFENIEIVLMKQFGKGEDHLQLNFKNSAGDMIPAIGFFMLPETSDKKPLEIGKKINLVATVEKSMFRGRPELRLRIVEIFV
ncbi:single-stranded-DNA-specific exonuclease RecJ [Patescibacteria group bacterium]